MSFRLKTIIGVGIIETILLFILIGSSLRFLKNSTEEELQKRAKTTAKLFATTTKDAVLSSDLASLQSFVEEVMSNAELEYARVLGQGQVLAEEGKKELLTKKFHEDTDYKLIDDNVFDTYANITEGGEIYGRVEVGISVLSLKNTYDKAVRQTLVIASIELILSALFSFLLGSLLTKRLKKLKKATKIVAQGDYEHQILISGNDELSEVSHSFNKMVSNLNTAQSAENLARQELQLMNESLEKKVSDRTKDLSKKTQDLEQAMELLEAERQKQVESAYQAGIAENAISILHNVGNFITPIVAKTSMLRDSKQLSSVAAYLDKIKNLLSNQLGQKNLANFLETDKKGSQVLPVLEELANKLKEIEGEQKRITIGIEERLTDIAEIISSQEKYTNFKAENINYQITELIQDTLKLKSNIIDEANIKVSLKFDEHLKPMYGNKNKLMQILLSLVSNSIESIIERSRVEHEYRGEIQITIKDCFGKYYSVDIADNGIGSEQKDLENAFKFGFSTKKQSSGFGLHDCGNFILANKGKIALNSEGKLKGANAYFEFPYQMGQINKP